MMPNAVNSRRATQLPPQLKPYLILLHHPTTLPICRLCHIAILPKSLADHLRKQHKLPIPLRPPICLLVATLPSLDFSSVRPRPDGSEPLTELRTRDAYQCKRCNFIRRDVSDVRRHVNDVHAESAAGAYGKVKAQSWFGGRRAVYWRVCGGGVEKSEKAVALSNEDSLADVLNADTLGCLWGLFGKGWGHRQPVDGRGQA